MNENEHLTMQARHNDGTAEETAADQTAVGAAASGPRSEGLRQPEAGAQPEGGRWSRRKLLASLGAAGVALAAGGVVNAAAAKGSVTAATYGHGNGKGQGPLGHAACCELSAKSADELRTIAGSEDGQPIRLLGYYETEPGRGGGVLFWDADSTESDNGGTVFAVVRRSADGSGCTTGG